MVDTTWRGTTSSADDAKAYSIHPLVQVASVLIRIAQPAIPAIPHVAAFISKCLDTSVSFSLPEAAEQKSAWLLERVVARILNGDPVHCSLLDHWFAVAMETAIKNDDLATVQKIHTFHPEPLVVFSLKLAFQYASLETIQWVFAHRCDRLCCPPGVSNLCPECYFAALPSLGNQDPIAIVKWLHEVKAPREGLHPLAPMWSVVLRNVDLLQWFDTNEQLDYRDGSILLRSAIAGNSLDVVKYLVSTGHSASEERIQVALIECSCRRDAHDVTEFVVASRLCDSFRHKFVYASTTPRGRKVLQWGQDYMNDTACYSTIVQELTRRAHWFVHVDAIRWLYEAHGIRPRALQYSDSAQQRDVLDLYKWMHDAGVGVWSPRDMDQAARYGFLDVVQWLHANRPEGCTENAMDLAAEGGHLAVLEWIFANRSDGMSKGLEYAAANGYIEVVQWLDTNFEIAASDAMIYAALGGQLDVLVWLNASSHTTCAACALHAVLQFPDLFTECHALRFPVLNAIRWLQDQGASAACVGTCFELDDSQSSGVRMRSLAVYAAKLGDLVLLEFLHEHYGSSGKEQAARLDSYGASLDLFCGNEIHRVAFQYRHHGVAQWLDHTSDTIGELDGHHQTKCDHPH